MSLKDNEEVLEKGAMDKKEKEETDKKEGEEAKKDDKDQDVVFVQDVGFTVKIIAPNLEPFDIQVKAIFFTLICFKVRRSNFSVLFTNCCFNFRFYIFSYR